MKLAMIFCVFSLLLIFTACSSQNAGAPQAAGNKQSPENKNVQPSSSSGQETKEKPNKYQVGVVFPLSGNAAELGKDMLAGVEYATKQINDKGGINGVPIELVVEDGKALPKDSANAAQKLITVNKLPAIFTGFSSPVLASAPIATQNKVLLINAAAATPALAAAGEYLLNTLVLQNIELKHLTKYGSEELGIKKMSIMYQNNDLGLGSKDVLDKYMTEVGGKLVAAESYEVGAVDFRTQLSKIRQAEPDAIYLASAGKDTPLIIKQARDLGIKAQFLGYHSLQMPPEYMKIAGNGAEGGIYTSSAAEVSKEFADKWVKDHNGKAIESSSAMYYDAALMLYEGIEKAIKSGYGFTGEGIRKAIFEIGKFEGVTGKMVMTNTGNANKAVRIKKIENGDFKVLKVIEP